jgi:O-antigen ligase
MFLPNLGFTRNTELGVLELSDLLIGPYLLLVWIGPRRSSNSLIDRVRPVMILFVTWAFLGTALINFRYDYLDAFNVQFGLLKLGKLVLYGFAGYLTVKSVRDDTSRRGLAISLLAVGLVLGIGLVLFGQKSATRVAVDPNDPVFGFKASNGISVLASMIACYLCGVWVTDSTLRRWRKGLTIATMIVLVLGSAISEGRGGWVAGMAGFIYLVYRGSVRWEHLTVLLGTPIIILVFYSIVPAFHNRVEVTLHPEEVQYNEVQTIQGIDVGSRPQEWIDGIGQFKSPIFGTGFYHRGGLSGLYETGSHNFFIQMFLETGIVGGCLILIVFYRLWNIAGSPASRAAGLDLPSKASLVAALVGGMGGEYFYGGIILFGMFVLLAGCGSLDLNRNYTRIRLVSTRRTLTSPQESEVVSG